VCGNELPTPSWRGELPDVSRLAFTDPALWPYAFGFPRFLRIESPFISIRWAL